jgi:hypothetical protein
MEKLSFYTFLFAGIKGERLMFNSWSKVFGSKNPNLEIILRTFEVYFSVEGSGFHVKMILYKIWAIIFRAEESECIGRFFEIVHFDFYG